MTRAFAVSLIIPDNEAFTAYETLARLAIPVARVLRSDLWLFDVDESGAAGLAGTLAGLETIYNPNKHRLVERASADPEPGEVWIATRDEAPATAIAGRHLAGVTGIRHATAWRLLDEAGRDLDSAQRDRAVTMFLCNPAYQTARTG
jgi:hypothetical protein